MVILSSYWGFFIFQKPVQTDKKVGNEVTEDKQKYLIYTTIITIILVLYFAVTEAEKCAKMTYYEILSIVTIGFFP